MRTRVAAVGGGANSEHVPSYVMADSVCAALPADRFDVVRLNIARGGGWLDHDGKPLPAVDAMKKIADCDVLFPLVGGVGGEDGTLAALAVMLGVRLVGSGVRAGAIGVDKWATKLVAEAVGIPVAAGRLVRAGEVVEWTGPVVVKPVSAGSSNGASLVSTHEGLAAALALAFAEDDRVLVEEVLVGREIDISVLRCANGSLRTLASLEVCVDGFFDYAAKYGGGSRFESPASLTADEERQLGEHAIAMFEALGCSGVARVDFFLTERGWVLNEVNTIPGLTGTSQVPLMASAAGMSYTELLVELIEGAAKS